MKFPNKETVEKLRKEYPVGTRVELVSMDDFQAPPLGTKGTVKSIDDTGSLLVNWDNGSGLKVFKGYFPLPPLALSRRYWKAKSSGFFYSVLPKSIESRICHHLSFLLNVITAWHIKPNTREKQPPPNSDAPHPAPDIVIKPPTKKIPMPRNIPTP